MIYVVMNNGCYGLTKGQDSATADKGSIAKAGNMNRFEGIDLCSLAIELGATFVAQSFSGDKSQLIPILQAAMSHKGFALVNVISPCVTFNNNNGSTKSYDYVREHNESMGRIDFVPIGEEITTQYADDEVKEVKFHDGSEVLFHKLRKDFDPENKIEVINAIQNARSKNEILTGILYLDRHGVELNDLLNTTAVPLNQLTEKELCPGSAMLAEINQGYR